MTGMHYVLDVTEVPDAAITQFRVVSITSTGVKQADAAGQVTAYGVCMEEVTAGDVTAGRFVAIRVLGMARGVAGGTLVRGDYVRTDATGKLVALAATTVNQRQV